MSTTKKFLIFVLILIVVIVVTFFFFRNYKKENEIIIPEIIKEETVLEAKESDQVYNPDFLIGSWNNKTFKYPNDWTIVKINNKNGVLAGLILRSDIYNNFISIGSVLVSGGQYLSSCESFMSTDLGLKCDDSLGILVATDSVNPDVLRVYDFILKNINN